MSYLKIAAGKFYRTGYGHKVRIYCTDANGDFPIHGAILRNELWSAMVWTEGGHYAGEYSPHGHDIISEWSEPPVVDWSKFPEHIKYLAMDSSYRWRVYTDKPSVGKSEWKSTCDYYSGFWWVKEEDCPAFTGDWRDSLVARPGCDQ